MKKFSTGMVCALVAMAALAAEEQHHAKKPHALLEQLKPLAGTWEATVEGERVTTTYAVGSNGSTIVEQLMPESVAMLNVIHADGDGALLMTHYCAAYNQPRYRATALEGGRIAFTFVDGTNLGDAYMAGLTLTMKDADHLTQEWTHRAGTKDQVVKFEFTRVK